MKLNIRFPFMQIGQTIIINYFHTMTVPFVFAVVSGYIIMSSYINNKLNNI